MPKDRYLLIVKDTDCMLSNIINIFGNTYEVDATILVILVLSFKLYINNTATAIDYKRTFVSIPGEITILVIGFLLSDMITNESDTSTGQRLFTGILISLLVLVIQIAWEKDICNKLTNLGRNSKWKILVMYAVSVALYLIALKGGFGK